MVHLPDFPWDRLTAAKQRASEHPGGIVDLSVGTPVDPTPQIVQQALSEAADAPGYPTTHGTAEVREAAAGWLQRCLGVTADPSSILPLIGTKEFVAWLPTLLGLGAGDTVACPPIAYPTYEVGAMIAGCRTDGGPASLTWLNTPANPTGAVMSPIELREAAQIGRAGGGVVVSDECYIELGWDVEPVSLLHPQVCDDDHTGLLAIHSLSKRSNMAGYRFGFAVGDPSLIDRLLQVRKHAGMMVPLPVQAAARAALDDDAHVSAQREVYRSRRDLLRSALEAAGFRIDHSQAGLYLWATRGQSCWDTVNLLADSGILVAPGDFYGTGGADHVRVALTGRDERVGAAVARLRAL
ncbi:MAG: succinyldiaminopimelate transaminase [Candidatus Nanopelagicales bacterium]|nr:succinyldiaminopimelate transaminase [Candidatus Nanopelagicales bacterium]